MLVAPAWSQRPSAAPTRLEPGTEVVVDGVLDEPFWKTVTQLGALTQVEPVEGARPTRATEVRLAFDSERMYVGVHCFDEPSEVRARQMNRDAFVRYDDVVEIWFDTFDDSRFGFWFQLTAGGSRGDALLSDSGNSFNKNWDAIWTGRSTMTSDGWSAEFAIPFQSLAFSPGQNTWGFNIRRKRIANGETARWASPHVAYRFFKLSEGGALTGLTGLDQGAGLDVVPYAKGGFFRDDLGQTDSEFDIGLDVSWRPTASTTMRFTANTDFAETEVDERQINLTRFPLFFPEKRDFFLEDAGVFEFGVPNRRPDFVPFFSRTIGRDADGAAVPLRVGMKVTGKWGPWNVGVLDTLVDDSGDVPEKNLGVVRVSRNLGGENAAGVLVTTGRPDAEGDAATYGADFRVGSSRLFGEGRSGSLWGWALKTSTEGEGGDGAAFGLEARTSSSSWRNSLRARRIEEGYDPALGFVRRTGIDDYRAESQYTWRGDESAGVRQYTTRVAVNVQEDLVGNEDGWSVPMRPFEIEFQSEDRVEYEIHRIFERLDESFVVGDGVDVSAGEYLMTRHMLEFETNDRRLVKSELELEWGDFFSGDIFQWQFSPIVIPSKYFQFALSYTDVDIDLDEGDFDTQLVGVNFDFTFSPALTWTNFIQYDTESDDLGVQSRLHWIKTPGQDLFVVALLGWDRTDRDSFRRTGQELVVKATYTLRF